MKAVPPKTSSVRSLATVWIAAALVLLALDLVARAKPQPVWEREEEQLIRFQAAKVDALKGGEILLLGDSSLGTDIDARVVSEVLGRSSVKLALVASFTTMGDEALLERALEAGKKPSAIVLFHTPDLWPRPFAEDFYAILERGLGRYGLESGSRELARTLALAEQNKAWKLRTFRPLHGIAPSATELEQEVAKSQAAREALPRTDYIPPAAKARPDWPAMGARIASGESRPLILNPSDPAGSFRVDAHVERSFDRTLELAAAHGVPVFVAICPTWLPKLAYPANRRFARELDAWLEQKSEGGARFRRLWRPTLVVRDEAAGDKAEHLDPSAMEPFSRWFAERLRRALANEDDSRITGELWDPIRDEPVVLE